MTYDGLQPLLIPTYIRELPQTDAWDHRFTYIGAQDGQTYRIISAGPDGVVANDSLDASAMRPNGSDDVIYSNGSVIQKPASNTPSLLRPH